MGQAPEFRHPGRPWDTQSDMAMALIGALAALFASPACMIDNSPCLTSASR